MSHSKMQKMQDETPLLSQESVKGKVRTWNSLTAEACAKKIEEGLSQSLGLTTSYWYCYDNASPSWFYQPSSWGSFISWGASNDPDVNLS